MDLQVYPDKYYYQVDYILLENDQVIDTDTAFLFSQVQYTERQMKSVIRSIRNKPNAEVKISTIQELDRATFVSLGGRLPNHF